MIKLFIYDLIYIGSIHPLFILISLVEGLFRAQDIIYKFVLRYVLYVGKAQNIYNTYTQNCTCRDKPKQLLRNKGIWQSYLFWVVKARLNDWIILMPTSLLPVQTPAARQIIFSFIPFCPRAIIFYTMRCSMRHPGTLTFRILYAPMSMCI